MDVKDKVAFISPLLTAAGTLVALWNANRALRQTRAKTRADWMFQSTMTFHKEKSLYDIFHQIDYKKFEFRVVAESAGGDLGTQKERDLIFYLDFLNGVSAAYEADIFKAEYVVMSTLGYAISVTLENKIVRAYLDHVSQHDENESRGANTSFGFFRRVNRLRPFEHLRIVAEKLDRESRHHL